MMHYSHAFDKWRMLTVIVKLSDDPEGGREAMRNLIAKFEERSINYLEKDISKYKEQLGLTRIELYTTKVNLDSASLSVAQLE